MTVTVIDSSIINSREEIAKIDEQNILGSVEALPDQCMHAWDDANKVEVPEDYKDVYNVVACGMGGSGLGARVIESVFADQLTKPFTRVHDYDLPNYVNYHSLVIISAYSGTTEEPVECARQAIEKRAKWMAIGTGNTLLEMAQKDKVPFYQIDPIYNPSNQPRMAIGYSLIGQIVLASKAGLFNLSKSDLDEVKSDMLRVQESCKVEVPVATNPAKTLAMKLKGRTLCYISARHLVGAAHTVNNQLNENAKNFSFDYVIPELNHHLMEGLKHPEANPQNLYAVFLNSDLYPERIKQRFQITQDVVTKNNIEHYEFKPMSQTKLGQAFEVIQFGAYVNLYLSVLYGQNPAPIPWVDYFKVQLGQPLGK